mmetsp:Transcript_11530/g.28415  ORF Transcript_11530/g.28415 Transcript_11530/m.28415 type:complete len:600 (-) Transcript_11530:621-2420(-)
MGNNYSVANITKCGRLDTGALEDRLFGVEKYPRAVATPYGLGSINEDSYTSIQKVELSFGTAYVHEKSLSSAPAVATPYGPGVLTQVKGSMRQVRLPFGIAHIRDSLVEILPSIKGMSPGLDHLFIEHSRKLSNLLAQQQALEAQNRAKIAGLESSLNAAIFEAQKQADAAPKTKKELEGWLSEKQSNLEKQKEVWTKDLKSMERKYKEVLFEKKVLENKNQTWAAEQRRLKIQSAKDTQALKDQVAQEKKAFDKKIAEMQKALEEEQDRSHKSRGEAEVLKNKVPEGDEGKMLALEEAANQLKKEKEEIEATHKEKIKGLEASLKEALIKARAYEALKRRGDKQEEATTEVAKQESAAKKQSADLPEVDPPMADAPEVDLTDGEQEDDVKHTEENIIRDKAMKKSVDKDAVSLLCEWASVTYDITKQIPNIQATRLLCSAVALQKVIFDGETITSNVPKLRRAFSTGTSKGESGSSLQLMQDGAPYLVVTVVDEEGTILGRSARTDPGELGKPVYIVRGSNVENCFVFIQLKRTKNFYGVSAKSSDIAYTFCSMLDLDKYQGYDLTLPMYKKPVDFTRDSRKLVKAGGTLTMQADICG